MCEVKLSEIFMRKKTYLKKNFFFYKTIKKKYGATAYNCTAIFFYIIFYRFFKIITSKKIIF